MIIGSLDFTLSLKTYKGLGRRLLISIAHRDAVSENSRDCKSLILQLFGLFPSGQQRTQS